MLRGLEVAVPGQAAQCQVLVFLIVCVLVFVFVLVLVFAYLFVFMVLAWTNSVSLKVTVRCSFFVCSVFVVFV